MSAGYFILLKKLKISSFSDRHAVSQGAIKIKQHSLNQALLSLKVN
jgi:hypothetical protein